MSRPVAGLILALLATSASAQEVRLTLPEIAALAKAGAGPGSSGVTGVQTTTLYGDPTKPGPYTIEIRVPANTEIAAHRHRDDRSAVVVSGTWYFGYGPKAAPALVKTLPAGSFYTEPAGAPHFAMTRDVPVVAYISGIGPTDTVYDAVP